MTPQTRYRRKAKARIKQKATYDRWYSRPENQARVRERAAIWAGTHSAYRRAYQAIWALNKRREARGLGPLPAPEFRSVRGWTRDARFYQSMRERMRRWAVKYWPEALKQL